LGRRRSGISPTHRLRSAPRLGQRTNGTMEPVADSFRVHPGVIVHAATGKEAPDSLLGLSAREVLWTEETEASSSGESMLRPPPTSTASRIG
jgi:hypothetical protein